MGNSSVCPGIAPPDHAYYSYPEAQRVRDRGASTFSPGESLAGKNLWPLLCPRHTPAARIYLRVHTYFQNCLDGKCLRRTQDHYNTYCNTVSIAVLLNHFYGAAVEMISVRILPGPSLSFRLQMMLYFVPDIFSLSRSSYREGSIPYEEDKA